MLSNVMGKRFFNYIAKVFYFPQIISGIFDSRSIPLIPTHVIWLTAFLMMLTRKGSLNSIEIESRISKRLNKLVGQHLPSADTIGRVFSLMDSDSLRLPLTTINHKVKRNKMLKNSWPIRVAAVDGHEFFSLKTSMLQRLPDTKNYG